MFVTACTNPECAEVGVSKEVPPNLTDNPEIMCVGCHGFVPLAVEVAGEGTFITP